jgi:RNA-directed DNA polymerase
LKRAGNLFSSVIDWENLYFAFHRAEAGKKDRLAVRKYAGELGQNLLRMRSGLIDGTFPIGRYNHFVVHDPKQRIIHAAAFPERVLHHALMNVCEREFEQFSIYDSYACRRGKGSLAAVKRAQAFSKKYSWFLKMDVRRYFDSIDHRLLLAMLKRKFKDPQILEWFTRIIGSFEKESGKGLPIGSLTSQYFANFYLAPLDRFIKETLLCRAYVRYMDDFVVWENDPERIHAIFQQITTFLADELQLGLRDFSQINRTAKGMTFLGYRLFPESIQLSQSSRNRFRRKIKKLERDFQHDRIDEAELQTRSISLLAFTDHADCRTWRLEIFHGAGPKQARIASIAAAAGTMMPVMCAPLIATGTNRATATTTSASALPQQAEPGSSPDRLERDGK